MELSNEDFDFENVGVSEDTYYSFLRTLEQKDVTKEITHSLPLNEVKVTLVDGATVVFDTIVPRFIDINSVSKKEGTNELELTLRTTGFLATPEEKSERIYPGAYSLEALAFIKAQLDLFDEIKSTFFVPGNTPSEKNLVVIPEGSLESTHIFNEVLDRLGATIRKVAVSDGEINHFHVDLDRSVEFSATVADYYRYNKMRKFENETLEDSGEKQVPCGHTVSPQILSIGGLQKSQLHNFPTGEVDGLDVYEVEVENSSDALPKPVDLPEDLETTTEENSTPVVFARGYVCEECDIVYPYVNEEEARKKYAGPTEFEPVKVSSSPYTYTFLVNKRPLKPYQP